MSDENEQSEQKKESNINSVYWLGENKVYNIFFNNKPEDPEKYIYGGWEVDASGNKMWSVVFFKYDGIKNTQNVDTGGIRNMSLIIPVSYFGHMDFKQTDILKINVSDEPDDAVDKNIQTKIQGYMSEIHKTKTSEIIGGNPYSKLKRRKGRKTKKSRKSKKSRKNRK